MSHGSIWVKECTVPELDQEHIERESNRHESVGECVLVHGEVNQSSSVDGTVSLREGEIGVFGCVASRLLPLVNLNERTPDIRLLPGEFARIRCLNALGQITDEVDVSCGRPTRLVATRDLRISQFVIITCMRAPSIPQEDDEKDSTRSEIDVDEQLEDELKKLFAERLEDAFEIEWND